ncbi:protein phosphatase methylesterase 1-like isoform X3 [Haliotis cracherodii]|uniref:protein phosphatase methylesterase 1-like isoform X3 n=1 Tax=Haliotis cracherodii TaxID=6455 RepID=UPI0039EA043B
MSALGKEVMKKRVGLPPMPTAGPSSSSSGSSGRRALMRKRDYTPVYWDKYFEKMHDVETDIGNSFRVYECGSEGPVLLLLHGGGFSALSWAVLSCDVSRLVKCRCAALDLRGHGDSMTSDDTDLSADTMAKDVGDVVTSLYGEDPPPIILVGHSMGGAIAVHSAVRDLIPSLIGLCVIDVVEGTALDALNSMQSFLRGRPKSFRSLEQAIEWVVRTGQIRNVDSARVSMVGQVKRSDTNETASSELEHMHEESPSSIGSIQEEDEEESGGPPLPPPQASFTQPQSSSSYTWRIDLSKTEQFWKGVDRLDKDLTIGQMQGKFQMQVLPQSGHAVHEDCPDRVAEVLATFMVRHKVADPTTNFERSFPAC